MNAYKYRPIRFYIITFTATWLFWIAAAIAGHGGADEGVTTILMLLGLLVPSVTALVTVLTSQSAALKRDLRDKLVGTFRVKPGVVLTSIALFFSVIAASILLSTLFGQSLNQFSFVSGFSFSIGGVPTLLTLILAAFFEELGWRGYAEDSLAYYMSWWKESILFGLLWSLWHLPLFFIPDTYQYNILQANFWFMVNFFVSIIPLGFLFTWVYVKNNRSILACMFFHFFVNFLQEQIAITQVTKCVETIVLLIAAGFVVVLNKDLFFETRHIGNLLGE